MAQTISRVFVSKSTERIQRKPNDNYFARDKRKAPLITYGRRSKPSPLTGQQFRRHDTYDIPLDDGGHEDTGAMPKASQNDDAEDSDSALSDAKLSPDWSLSSARSWLREAEAAHSTTRTARQLSPTGTVRSKKGTVKWGSNSRIKPAFPPDAAVRSHTGVSRSKQRACKSRRSSGDGHEKEQRRRSGPSRKLPVNELLLVSSPLRSAPHEPASSYAGIQTQDPITNSSSSASLGSVLPVSSNVSADTTQRRKTPLSAIGKRLRVASLKHKSLAGFRRRGRARTPKDVVLGNYVGDGFEASELRIAYHLSHRKPHSAHPPRFNPSALEVKCGPLPDVDFDRSDYGSKLEVSAEPGHANGADWDDSKQDSVVLRPSRSVPAPRRRVSFSDGVKNDLVLAQLSSVSAPKRYSSATSDEDEDHQTDSGEEYEDDEQAEHQQDIDQEVEESEDEDDSQENGEADSHIGNPTLAGPEAQHRVDDTESPQGCLLAGDEPATTIAAFHPRWYIRPVSLSKLAKASEDRSPSNTIPANTGTSLDLRRTTTLRQLPRRFDRKRKLIEVNEAILDEPAVGQSYDDLRVERAVSSAVDKLPRPRSILKNSTQVMPDSTSRPDQTKANTHRNSMINIEDSRYFTTAAEQLASSSPRKHQVVRRSSSYFNQPAVEAEDSRKAVPETSPKPPNYANFSQLSVPWGSSGAMWASSVPAVAKDLKTLTRTVSREHGTMSQSVRRRPSLPFTSPTRSVMGTEEVLL